MPSRSWMACAPPHLKPWVGFHDHPHSRTDWKRFRWPVIALRKGSEFRRPGGRCGHSAPCWFKNSISNPTQMRLLLRAAVSVKRVGSKSAKLSLAKERLTFKMSSLSGNMTSRYSYLSLFGSLWRNLTFWQAEVSVRHSMKPTWNLCVWFFKTVQQKPSLDLG